MLHLLLNIPNTIEITVIIKCTHAPQYTLMLSTLPHNYRCNVKEWPWCCSHQVQVLRFICHILSKIWNNKQFNQSWSNFKKRKGIPGIWSPIYHVLLSSLYTMKQNFKKTKSFLKKFGKHEILMWFIIHHH